MKKNVIINNDFNDKVIYNLGCQLLENGKYVNAKDLKIVGTENQIDHIEVDQKDNKKFTLVFHDKDTDTHYYGVEKLKDRMTPVEADYNFINNHGEYYNFENIYFEGFAENRNEVEKKLKEKLAEHCIEEIEKTIEEIERLNKYLNTMKEYKEIAMK